MAADEVRLKFIADMEQLKQQMLAGGASVEEAEKKIQKLAKAYRLRDLDAAVDDLATKHGGFTKFVNTFLRSPRLLEEYKRTRSAHQAICRSAASLARAKKMALHYPGRTLPAPGRQ